MAFHSFYQDLAQRARHDFPGLKELPEIAWDHLISPVTIRLPESVQIQARASIEALYQVSRRTNYLGLLGPAPIGGTQHHSVLMAYDFHTLENGTCRLVEVNTNASGFLVSTLMECNHKQISVWDSERLQLLKQSFENELKLFGLNTRTPHVAIVDEDPLNQKMLLEFIMYRTVFEKWGWTATICDSKDLRLDQNRLIDPQGRQIDLVYNRSTDFYFEELQHASLRMAFDLGLAVITPNPREYFLLADKERLVQLSQPDFLESARAQDFEREAIRQVLIPTYEKTHFESVDEIWAKRKNLFFKPKRSYGGKSVYRGESVSRKVFERLMAEDILIQSYQPAQKVPTDDPRSVLNNWKFDLRFFVYENSIQMTAARIYQGQVTNFHSPLGGFTLVEFSS